nr:rhodanese-like domain-containing protein [Flavobacterium daejeonense]
MDLQKTIQANEGTIIDVRSYGEFMSGHVAGSVNITLNQIPERIEEIKQLQNTFNSLLCFRQPKQSGATFSIATRNQML